MKREVFHESLILPPSKICLDSFPSGSVPVGSPITQQYFLLFPKGGRLWGGGGLI